MEQNPGINQINQINQRPKYTMRWLGIQGVYVLALACVLAVLANGIMLTRSTYALLLGSLLLFAALAAVMYGSLKLQKNQ